MAAKRKVTKKTSASRSRVTRKAPNQTQDLKQLFWQAMLIAFVGALAVYGILRAYRVNQDVDWQAQNMNLVDQPVLKCTYAATRADANCVGKVVGTKLGNYTCDRMVKTDNKVGVTCKLTAAK